MSLTTIDKKQEKKPKYTGTKGEIYGLMTESTGTHFLDSGGDEGRAWQKNRKNNFDKAPAAFFSFDPNGECYITGNLFDILAEHLTYDEEASKAYEAFDEDVDPDHKEPWLSTMELFAEGMDSEYTSGNSYEIESSLTGTIQWVKYTDHGGNTVWLIQHHGGADMRGGYTCPKAFRAHDDDTFLRALSDLNASCDCKRVDIWGPHLIDSEDGDRIEWPKHWIQYPGDGPRSVRAHCTSCMHEVQADITRH